MSRCNERCNEENYGKYVSSFFFSVWPGTKWPTDQYWSAAQGLETTALDSGFTYPHLLLLLPCPRTSV